MHTNDIRQLAQNLLHTSGGLASVLQLPESHHAGGASEAGVRSMRKQEWRSRLVRSTRTTPCVWHHHQTEKVNVIVKQVS